MLKVGFIGWRGMVGSVLIERMKEERDFNGFEPIFFSTSQVGQEGPDIGLRIPELQDAYNINELSKMDILVSCQGGDYTTKIYAELIGNGWKGYWIDAASTLRMDDETIIVLDPVNRHVIDKGLRDNIKAYIGGNCTVSLMLMALNGLFKNNCIEWISSMTYQAASGAGAKYMRELIEQMSHLGKAAENLLSDPSSSALELDRVIMGELRSRNIKTDNFGVPLAASLIPWIDKQMDNGQTREEWKGKVETNKILQTKKEIPVDGQCVRISSMRCHSQGLTIKLTGDIPLDEVTDMISKGNNWVKVIPNNKEETIEELTPAKVSGTLSVPIGRIRKMNIGSEFLTAFTVGDQLLWGAAEPLRRTLRIILEYVS